MCGEEGCDQPAVFSYRWEWGATGKCCSMHAALLQQTATTLQRSIALHPLLKAGPAPLLRDERIQLTARALTLEAELDEAKSRGLEVYRRNGDLQVQLNTAVVKERELKAQLSDAAQTLSRVQAERDSLNQRNGELLVELDRLRSLETFVAERHADEQHAMGLEGDQSPTVVDG
jgi:hypothetical protein